MLLYPQAGNPVLPTENQRKGATHTCPQRTTTKWIGIGLLGLPLYGVLTFWPSLDPQPDPNTDYEAWAHYVSLMVGTDTEKKVLVTSSLGVPSSTAASTRNLRSLEYGFIPEG